MEHVPPTWNSASHWESASRKSRKHEPRDKDACWCHGENTQLADMGVYTRRLVTASSTTSPPRVLEELNIEPPTPHQKGWLTGVLQSHWFSKQEGWKRLPAAIRADRKQWFVHTHAHAQSQFKRFSNIHLWEKGAIRQMPTKITF